MMQPERVGNFREDSLRKLLHLKRSALQKLPAPENSRPAWQKAVLPEALQFGSKKNAHGDIGAHRILRWEHPVRMAQPWAQGHRYHQGSVF